MRENYSYLYDIETTGIDVLQYYNQELIRYTEELSKTLYLVEPENKQEPIHFSQL